MSDGIDQVVEAGRQLVESGLSGGTSGNLSIRSGDRVLVTATGAELGRLTADDIAVLDLDGRRVEGPKASKEWPLHLAFYRRSEEHRAVVHVHSPSAVAVSCLQPWADHSAIAPLTPYFVMRVGQTPLLPYRPPGDPAMADDLRDCPWDVRAVLLANHGPVVAAPDVATAVDRALQVEEVSQTMLLTAQLPVRTLTEDQVGELVRQWGAPWQVSLQSAPRGAQELLRP